MGIPVRFSTDTSIFYQSAGFQLRSFLTTFI